MGEQVGSHVLVVLPTYNERDNIEAIVRRILAAVPSADLWVVDDNSPDGTGSLADALAASDPRVTVFHRPGKAGLGTAYTESFSRALELGYDYIVEMDADFSHDPAVLPDLLSDARHADLVLGSRYVPGGSTPNWSLLRRGISHIGNIVARALLGLPVHDATTGYRVFRKGALERIHLQGIQLQGYGFQIESVYQCHRAGLRIHEHPIRFYDRREGHSKMSRAIVGEALLYVFERRFKDVFKRTSVVDEPNRVGDAHYPPKDADNGYQNVQPVTPLQAEIPVDQLEGP